MNDEQKAAAERDKTAKHLAGRAIMAMRAGFPIVSLTVHTGSAAESGETRSKRRNGVKRIMYRSPNLAGITLPRFPHRH